MKRKMLVFLMVAVISLSVVFTACNKDVYVDPSTDSEYILVTDENGKKVLSEDGELIVYVTDADGKKVKDDNGEYVTEIRGFVGQIEENGVIEDYAYYFTLPDGWNAVNDRGEFENKKTKSTLQIQILEETIDEAIAKVEKVYNALNSQKDKTEEFKVLKNVYDNEIVNGKINIVTLQYDGETRVSLVFQNSGNTYQFDFSTTGDITVEDAEKETIEFLNSIEFKPYTYFPELTTSVNGGDSFVVEVTK
ncbi:MAG: hypothetical protein E7522_11035 [Ruminococcaceae bacterium]|nr:hypothetical protein [Oscillospiraceae bacterium]